MHIQYIFCFEALFDAISICQKCIIYDISSKFAIQIYQSIFGELLRTIIYFSRSPFTTTFCNYTYSSRSFVNYSTRSQNLLFQFWFSPNFFNDIFSNHQKHDLILTSRGNTVAHYSLQQESSKLIHTRVVRLWPNSSSHGLISTGHSRKEESLKQHLTWIYDSRFSGQNMLNYVKL